jgi:hypothetical protein
MNIKFEHIELNTKDGQPLLSLLFVKWHIKQTGFYASNVSMQCLAKPSIFFPLVVVDYQCTKCNINNLNKA